MAPADSALHIEVAYSPAPRQVQTRVLTLPAGSTVTDALRASGWLEMHAQSLPSLRLGVWGRVQLPDTALREGDRVELYRPLTVDPKEARRLRYSKQQRRSAP